MSITNVAFSGQVLLGTDAVSFGLLVETWDIHHLYLVDATLTDSSGRFEIRLDGSYLVKLYPDGIPEAFFFRVFQDKHLLSTTEDTITWRPGSAPRHFRIIVDPYHPPEDHGDPAPYVVLGRFVDAVGGPAARHTIQVFDRNLSRDGYRDDDLGTDVTGADGRFRIEYRLSPDRRATKIKADLVVRAFDPAGEQVAEAIVCQAPATAVVDLTAGGDHYAGPSDFERLTSAIAARLSDADVELTELSEEALEHLACSSEIELPDLRMLRDSERQARATRLPAELFYGLAREGIEPDLRRMVIHNANELKHTLDHALGLNRITGRWRPEREKLLQGLREAVVRDAFASPSEPGRPAIGDLLSIALAPREAQEDFFRSYLERTGSDQEFWQALPHKPGFEDPCLVDEFSYTMQLATLFQGNLPHLRIFRQRREEGSMPNSLREWIGRLDEKELERQLHEAADGGEIPLPPHIRGETIEEKVENYIRGILEPIKAIFPGPVLRQKIENRENIDPDLKTLLSNTRGVNGAPELDLLSTRIDHYLAEHSDTAFHGIDQKRRRAVTEQIHAIQRIARVTPYPEHVQGLLDAGLDSAAAINRIPRKHFVERFAELLGGSDEAEAVHDMGQRKATAAQMASVATRQALEYLPYAIVGNQRPKVQDLPDAPILISSTLPTPEHDTTPQSGGDEETDEGLPNWSTLFGQVSFCECEHCRSVYSPAAYLVDLLHMLEVDPIGAKPKPVKILFDRRPDIQHIKLTCANTNTPVPYIDIVNEVLESFVYKGFVPNADLTRYPDAFDTGDATAAELRAVPQNVIDEAYAELKNQVMPMTLPFHRPLAVVRTYLEHLQTSRLQVMESFRMAVAPTQAEIDREVLGMSPEEAAIVTDEPLPGQPGELWAYYGYPSEFPGGDLWTTRIVRVPEFLRKTGIDFEALVELRKTRFLNAGATMSVRAKAADCNLEKMEIEGLDLSGLERVHRFIRLWRKLGWTIPELDSALSSLGASDIGSTELGKLAAVQRLQAAIDLSIPELLALWASIDTHGDNSLYSRLLENRAVTRIEDPAVFALAAHRLDLDNPDQALDDHILAVLAALRITEIDLAMLRSTVTLEKNSTQTDALNLANLSTLYRHVVLARALKLRVVELLSLITLAPDEAHPFQPHDPRPTRNFVETARRVRRSNFSVVELDYLYRHRVEAGRPPVPSEDLVEQILEGLENSLLKIIEETAVPEATDPNDPQNTLPDDPTGEVLRSRLAMVFEEDTIIEQVMGIALGNPQTMPQDPQAFIQDRLAGMVDPVDAEAALVHPLPLSDEQRQGNIAYLLGKLVLYLRDTLSRGAVVQTLAEVLGLGESLLRWLLESAIQGRVKPGESALADFLALAEAGPVDEHFQTYELLHKAALLIKGFDMSEREVVHLSENAPRFGGFDLDALPLSTATDPTVLFSQWERLQNLFELKTRLPEDGLGLFDLFELEPDPQGDPLHELAAKLAEVTGWNADQVHALAGPDGFDFIDGDFRTEEQLIRVRSCLDVSRRVGVSAGKLSAWASSVPGPAGAREVVQAVKGRYEEQPWLEVAQTLNDRLREAQRSALVAFLLPRIPGIDTADQLFEHFLIDVEMSSCMATSRIKQAISSVQLFVQRCLLSLEQSSEPNQGVDPDAIDADQWQWRKNYRVWEANRKVFLYPENWIEPELRLGKSTFFRELEGELLQNDLTEHYVEQAFRNYLEKLNGVARLDIVAMYWQVEYGAGIDTLHVFGRSFDDPRRYYYRKLLKGREWTPWELLNIEIDRTPPSSGIHLIPVEFNRRLYLFWPVFEKEPILNNILLWRVKLAWSEYRQGRWSPRTSGDRSVQLFAGANDAETGAAGYSPATEYTFRSSIRPGFSQTSKVVSKQNLFLDVFAVNSLDFRHGHFELDVCQGTFNVGFKPALEIFGASYQPDKSHESDVAQPFANTPVFMKYRIDIEYLAINRAWRWDIHLVLGSLPPTPDEYQSEGESVGAFALFPHQRAPYRRVGGLTPFFFMEGERTYFAAPIPKKKAILDPRNTASIGGLVSAEAIGEESASPFLLIGKTLVEEATGLSPIGASRPIAENDYANWMLTSLAELRFSAFQHPWVCVFIKALEGGGVDGLLTLENQMLEETSPDKSFATLYEPTSIVAHPRPVHNIDFEFNGAYSLYNWELFFHIPLLIATRLSKDQRHEEAQRWFHYIFDPTTSVPGDVPARFWRFRPFHEKPQHGHIAELLAALHDENAAPAVVANINSQIADWVEHPFEPHRIARLRLVAYQKTVVMKYIDNLIDWGDQLFRRDTIESINEATQLYVLAARILGPRPQRIPPLAEADPVSYDDIRENLGSFSNVAAENLQVNFPYSIPGDGNGGASSVADTPWLYFCVPNNPTLLEYWDTVEDRLFKIRHCLNIEGVARELPLFEPSIDPAILVRARARGVDPSSVIADLYVPRPHYRFSYMIQKALELAGELKALGSQLLSVLEKKDAEALAFLNAEHQETLQQAVRNVREEQIRESERTRISLDKTREVTQARRDFYRDIQVQGSTDNPGLIAAEVEQLDELDFAHDKQEDGMEDEKTSSYLALLPDIGISSSGVIFPVITFGGSFLSTLFHAYAQEHLLDAAKDSNASARAGILGTWERRSQEWALQETLADKELAQIDEQIAAAELRIEIAKKELAAQEKQIEGAREVREFLRDKYTDEELYGWMQSQISAVYFQTYKLAYDMAKRAERAYRFERGLSVSDFVRSGYYWDSMKKGLLAGEALTQDLRRLETAYLQENRREYEITKHVSLVLHDPSQLIGLKEAGQCEIDLPESFFDADYPGHYFRRIKNVSISIPCVTGPYTGINCTLTLLSNRIRMNGTVTSGNYPEEIPDSRFLYDFAAIQSIATSHGQNDAGMFELNFRDERYLPFEGAGAVSRWRIDLFKDSNAFDFDTIADVVLTMNYTAREGGAMLRTAAKTARDALWSEIAGENSGPRPPLQRFISARHEFPNQWHEFSIPTGSQQGHLFAFTLTPERFPFRFRGRDIEISEIHIFAKLKEGIDYSKALIFDLKKGNGVDLSESDQTLELTPDSELPTYSKLITNSVKAFGDWTINISDNGNVGVKDLEDLWINLVYRIG